MFKVDHDNLLYTSNELFKDAMEHMHLLGTSAKTLRLVLNQSLENVTYHSGMRSISLDRGIDEASRGNRAAMAINAVLEKVDDHVAVADEVNGHVRVELEDVGDYIAVTLDSVNSHVAMAPGGLAEHVDEARDGIYNHVAEMLGAIDICPAEAPDTSNDHVTVNDDQLDSAGGLVPEMTCDGARSPAPAGVAAQVTAVGNVLLEVLVDILLATILPAMIWMAMILTAVALVLVEVARRRRGRPLLPAAWRGHDVVGERCEQREAGPRPGPPDEAAQPPRDEQSAERAPRRPAGEERHLEVRMVPLQAERTRCQPRLGCSGDDGGDRGGDRSIEVSCIGEQDASVEEYAGHNNLWERWAQKLWRLPA